MGAVERLKIAILGTRGIPNRYGGFEQTAERLAIRFVKRDIEVTVFNPSEHPYRENEWNGVKIERVPSIEGKLGPIGTLAYDLVSLQKALRMDFDIIVEMGYPAAIYYWLKRILNPTVKIVTLMDGLEWKRDKFNKPARMLLKVMEAAAIKMGDVAVADNPGIKEYLENKYGKEIPYIPLGAELFHDPDEAAPEKRGLEKFGYFMLVARFEPENNIHTILEGYLKAKSDIPFLLVGNPNATEYGKKLLKEYGKMDKLIFAGAIYDYHQLSSLRWFSRLYFHGHSVGGTNPSLLEAMASNALIAAHDNPFNRNILGEEGFYFSSSEDVAEIVKNADRYQKKRESFTRKNREKIEKIYNWDIIADQFIQLFEEMVR